MAGNNSKNDTKERVKSLESQISDVNDLEILNKLDIINLKNEIEKLKMSLGGPMEAPPKQEKPKKKKKKKKKSKKKKKKKSKKKGPEVPTCKKCGALLPKNAKYCGKCGEKR